MEQDPVLYESVRAGTKTLVSAMRELRWRKAEAERQARTAAAERAKADGLRIEMLTGDFREVLRDLRDVDAVITDPPYGKKFLPLLRDLAEWSDAVLKEDGVLVVLLGESWFWEARPLLSGFRPYRWLCCYMTPGPAYVSHDRGAHSMWKPLVVFGGGKDLRFGDVFNSAARHDGKEYHEWGQDFGAFQTIVERFTEPGQLIVDPFMGGGTTLLAAQSLGRHAIGCDKPRSGGDRKGPRRFGDLLFEGEASK
jgi:site-specific DNA-methyltransferase (adenine-specific)